MGRGGATKLKLHGRLAGMENGTGGIQVLARFFFFFCFRLLLLYVFYVSVRLASLSGLAICNKVIYIAHYALHVFVLLEEMMEKKV